MSEDKKRIIFFIIITIVCILAVIEAVYIYIYSPDGHIGSVGNTEITTPEEDKKQELKGQFASIFKNDLTSNIDTVGIYKKDNRYNLVYTSYNKVEKSNEQYEMDVQIPHINIDSDVIDNVNNEIDKIFKEKAEKILKEDTKREESTIYNIKYKAYINNNILSLMIQCTLKEDNESQKILMKTYCYNIITDKMITFDELAKTKNLKKNDIESEIKKEIDSQVLMEKTLEEAGYAVFKRNVESNIYKYENIDTFFIDNENNLYVVFAYGNTNSTSEVDLVIF